MEPITLPNINLNGALDPSQGYFNSEMLRVALGLPTTDAVGVAVQIGSLAAADFQESACAVTWLWKPATVQSYMTSAASATVRAAVSAWYVANPTAAHKG